MPQLSVSCPMAVMQTPMQTPQEASLTGEVVQLDAVAQDSLTPLTGPEEQAIVEA